MVFCGDFELRNGLARRLQALLDRMLCRQCDGAECSSRPVVVTMTEGFAHTVAHSQPLRVPEGSTTPSVPSDQPPVAAGFPCEFGSAQANDVSDARLLRGKSGAADEGE